MNKSLNFFERQEEATSSFYFLSETHAPDSKCIALIGFKKSKERYNSSGKDLTDKNQALASEIKTQEEDDM